MDVDLDTSARKRPKIIARLKKVFGEDNILNICTFRKETSKAALKTVCRGLDIPLEVAGYLSSLVPVERGAQWPLKDCFYGNENEERKPIFDLVTEADKISKEYHIDFKRYALMIENLISGLSLHASGIYIFKDGYIKQNSLMKTPRGDNITCWEMEDSDYAGGLKYDSLTTECQDKLEVATEILLKYKKIEWQGSIRATYNKYLHPDVINYDNQDMWDKCTKGEIADLFQFDTPVGSKCIQKIKPHNIIELTNANSLMRITTEDMEQPVDKFLKYKHNIQLWYDEIEEYGVTDKEEIKALEKVLKYCYGAPSMQEDVMELCMEPKIANFSLKEADKARKVIAKKKRNDVAALKKQFYDSVEANGNSVNVANYVWEACIKPQLAYSFSRNHVMPYSAEALQEMNIYQFYPSVYWNCATLTVNAGLADEEADKVIQYDKLAKGIYRSIKSGIPVLPPDINESELAFTPVEKTNKILFGLGCIAGVGVDACQQIIENRPYESFKDFFDKNSFKGSLVTLSKFRQLIKAGCFDSLKPNRQLLMKYLVLYTTEQKTEFTMANLNSIISLNIPIPNNLLTPYKFFKYITQKQFYYGPHPKFKSKKLYWLDETALKYFNKNYKNAVSDKEGIVYFYEDDKTIIVDKEIEKLLKPNQEELKAYINTGEFKDKYNKKLLRANYDKLCPNKDINHWAMEAISYYPNQEHELDGLDKEFYLISDYSNLPEEPVFIERTNGKRTWRQYDLAQIAGTVLDRNDSHHIVTILTTDNEVVNVKLNAGLFARYKKVFSDKDENGNKIILDASYFTRGQLLIFCGYRVGENDFFCKRYSKSIFQHHCQRILSINSDGTANIQQHRYDETSEE